MILRIISVFALYALTACALAPGTERLSAGQTVDIASAATQISVQRAGSGIVSPIFHSAALQAVAQAHVDDLARTDRFSHSGSDGSTLETRLDRAGYRACALAENLAQGPANVRSTIAMWMQSEDHRANILNAQMTQFGIARGAGALWVLVLARPC